VGRRDRGREYERDIDSADLSRLRDAYAARHGQLGACVGTSTRQAAPRLTFGLSGNTSERAERRHALMDEHRETLRRLGE
jgi:hypothetical protein